MLTCPCCGTPAPHIAKGEDPHYECHSCGAYLNLILLGAYQEPKGGDRSSRSAHQEAEDKLRRIREAGL